MFGQFCISEVSAAEAAASTEAAARATAAEASTATLAALTVTLAIALLLEHTEQLLRGEERGELCAILLLDVQAELLLLDLLGFAGKGLVELCSGLLIGEVFL